MTEWTISTLKEHWEKIHQKDLYALELQAREYERRLDTLNSEYLEFQKAQRTYVSYYVLAGIISISLAVVTIFVAIAAIYFRAGH